ncbi:hypothetical protein [Nocardioides sp. URHA0020]|uniref:hypothetical protein n=1 Tax=Nocardioides sp. URHA0020 TaxID=1380392 RepID=UPI000491226D|nr:hypothetical protein [Nocardioides sp. URHA0020]
MDQQTHPIQPPPSVDDLLALGTESRVGQVDFATRLRLVDPEPPAAPAIAPDLAPQPVVADLAADIGEPADESFIDAVLEPASERVTQPVGERVVEPEPEVARSAGPVILPIAQLSDLTRTVDLTVDAVVVSVVAPRTTPVPAYAPAYAPAPAPVQRVEAYRAPEDTSYLRGSVQEVADAAMERLRDAEEATLHHLVALETEAARRAELLTAQAELDAELIRITARREAHAIISAARTEAGLTSQPSREGRQLAEISDAVSLFAESIESSLAPLRSRSSHGDQ